MSMEFMKLPERIGEPNTGDRWVLRKAGQWWEGGDCWSSLARDAKRFPSEAAAKAAFALQRAKAAQQRGDSKLRSEWLKMYFRQRKG